MKPPIEYRPKPKRTVTEAAIRKAMVAVDKIPPPDFIPVSSDAVAILKRIRALNRKRAKAFRARKKAKK